MWFDGVRQPNTLYIASVSRGKDSTAMLRAIQLMGWPLDGIVSVDVWFDDDTPAELPPMVAFKDEWDKKCLEAFGIPVTRVCATKRERETEKPQATVTSSTESEQQESSSEQYGDFHKITALGARKSSMNKLTYTEIFYRKKKKQTIYGFPMQRGNWCTGELKTSPCLCPRTRGKQMLCSMLV